MKRFTILFSVLLVLGFGGVLAYVAASPEFVPPAALIGEGEDPDAPIWIAVSSLFLLCLPDILERLLQCARVALIEVQPHRKGAVVNITQNVPGAVEIDDAVRLNMSSSVMWTWYLPATSPLIPALPAWGVRY